MQFLELVGTLSRGEDGRMFRSFGKNVPVGLDRKKCRFCGFVLNEIVVFLTEMTI